MSICGMHLPNRPFAGDDLARLRALGVADYVDLHHFRDRWAQLVAEQPGARIHARIDVRGPLGDPAAEAADLAHLIDEQGAHVATWRYRNEPNLESPGVTPEQWRDWLAAFGRAVKTARPAARVYAPAVSPGTADWLAWLDATAAGARAGGLDGLDVHAYGNPDEVDAVVDAHRARWQGSLLMTEHNFGAGRSYDLARYAADLPAVVGRCADRGVEAVCLFIWHWQAPDMALPTSVDIRDTPIEAAVAALPRREPRRVVLNDRPVETERLRAYQQWAVARLANGEDPRDGAAFVAHLRALGADWRVPERYGFPELPSDDWRLPTSGLDADKARTYGEWAAARLAAGEDPRVVDAFVAHLRALGADWRAPHDYGLPGRSLPPEPAGALTDVALRQRYGRRGVWFHERGYPALAHMSGADLAEIVARQGYDAIYIKAGNGGYASPESGSERWPRQWNRAFIQPFLDRGITVCAWIYIYAWGKDHEGVTWKGPEAEADMLPWIRSVHDCPIIVDAEYEVIGQEAGLRVFADRVRGHGFRPEHLAYAPDLRIAFSNGWPRQRRDVVPGGGGFAWDVLNELCGAVLPQTYFHMFDSDKQVGCFDLCAAWQRGYPDAPPILPIFDRGVDLNDAVLSAEALGFPSLSVWAFDPRQPPLPATSRPAPPAPPPRRDPFMVRPDLDFSSPQHGYDSKPAWFQIIDEGVAEWHDSAEQFRDNYFDNCGPIAMAHVVNLLRWRQNNPQTMNAGDAIGATLAPLPEAVTLQTVDPARPTWTVPRGTRIYDSEQTLDVFGLAAVAKLLTGAEMVVRSTRQDVPGSSLGFDEALSIARTRPIVVNKPGHLCTVVADKGGKAILWLMQGWIGPRFNGDGGALTAANWQEWNWQCWYPAAPLWGVPGLGEEEDMALVAELQARNAQLEAMIADREARLAELVNRCGYVAGDLATIATTVGDQLTAAVAELEGRGKAGAARTQVEGIVRDGLTPVITAMRAVQPPSA